MQRRNEEILFGPQTPEQKRKWLWENCRWVIYQREYKRGWALWNCSWSVAVRHRPGDNEPNKFPTRKECVEYYFDRVPPRPKDGYVTVRKGQPVQHPDVSRWVRKGWK